MPKINHPFNVSQWLFIKLKKVRERKGKNKNYESWQ